MVALLAAPRTWILGVTGFILGLLSVSVAAPAIEASSPHLALSGQTMCAPETKDTDNIFFLSCGGMY